MFAKTLRRTLCCLWGSFVLLGAGTAVAGYADIGESLEQTVIREVKEEVGIEIKNLRYYSSQPWPFSSSMISLPTPWV